MSKLTPENQTIVKEIKTLTSSFDTLVRALQFKGGETKSVEDRLTMEAPLQVKINLSPYTITMRTPGEDRALTYGLLYTEGLISKASEVVEYSALDNPGEFPSSTSGVIIDPDMLTDFNLENRSLISNSSCGICGKTELSDLNLPEIPLPDPTPISFEIIKDLEFKMNRAQALFKKTGGCHAATIFDNEANILSLKEDVGRHNAVDKAIGEVLLKEELASAYAMFVSGRVSYEIVTKIYQAKIPYLIAVSAPSDMAVKLCCKLGISLIGFCRGNRATVYSHASNVRGE